MHDAQLLIDRLGLGRHPEGGWYRETWRAPSPGGTGRGAGTSILYLLEAGQRSHWHRIDASELWIFQAGTALVLSIADASGPVTSVRLGVEVLASEQPQQIVHPGQWQAAQAGAGWCLVACVVAPAFQFEGFELAPPDWSPGAG
jgi:hypothetical protein